MTVTALDWQPQAPVLPEIEQQLLAARLPALHDLMAAHDTPGALRVLAAIERRAAEERARPAAPAPAPAGPPRLLTAMHSTRIGGGS